MSATSFILCSLVVLFVFSAGMMLTPLEPTTATLEDGLGPAIATKPL